MTTIRFHDALRRAALALRDPILPADKPVRIIRDIYGRLRFAVDCAAAEFPTEARQVLEAAQSSLSPYATGDDLLFRESFSFPERVFGVMEKINVARPARCVQEKIECDTSGNITLSNRLAMPREEL